MKELSVQPLENTPVKEIAACFTQAFENYFFHVDMTEKVLCEKILHEQISLKDSMGCFHGEELVGFTLTAVYRDKAYNAGTGVLQEFQRHGISFRLFKALKPHLKKLGVKHYQLEVIDENFPAVRAYKKQGLHIDRTLLCYKGIFSAKSPKPNGKKNESSSAPSLPLVGKPSWQNNPETSRKPGFNLNSSNGKHTLGCSSGRIHYLASSDPRQFADAHSELSAMLGSMSQNGEWLATNVGEENEQLIKFLENNQFRIFTKQYEMSCKIQ